MLARVFLQELLYVTCLFIRTYEGNGGGGFEPPSWRFHNPFHNNGIRHKPRTRHHLNFLLLLSTFIRILSVLFSNNPVLLPRKTAQLDPLVVAAKSTYSHVHSCQATMYSRISGLFFCFLEYLSKGIRNAFRHSLYVPMKSNI